MKKYLIALVLVTLFALPTSAQAADQSVLNLLSETLRTLSNTLSLIKNQTPLNLARPVNPNCLTRQPQIVPWIINPIVWPGLHDQQFAMFYANRDSIDCFPSPIKVEVDMPSNWPQRLVPPETLVLPPGSNIGEYWKNIIFTVPYNETARIVPVTFRAINEISHEMTEQIVNVPIEIQPVLSTVTPTSVHIGDSITLKGSDFTSTPTILISSFIINGPGGYAYIPATSTDNGTRVTFTMPATLSTTTGGTVPAPAGDYSLTLKNSDNLWATNYLIFNLRR